MKILFATTEYPPFKGGVANYYAGIVKHFPQKNKIIVLDNSQYKLLNKKFIIPWLPAFFNICKVIKKEKITHVFVGQLLPIGTVVYLLSKFLKIKYTVFVHGMDLEYAKKIKRKKFLSLKILKNAKNIITNSNYVKDLVNDFINDKSKTKTVNPGIDIKPKIINKQIRNGIIKKYNLKNKKILLTVSRLVKRKGQDMVIEALNDLNPKLRKNVIYIIAGEGPDEQYLKEKAQNQKNVIFLGSVTNEERDVLLNLCDVFIMPARDIDGDVEGFGIVYLEANLAGKPVIAGQSGGISDAVVDYETGILCNPESKSDIAGAINELLHNWELKERLSTNGLKRAGDEFNWPKQTLKIYNIIKSYD